MRSLIADIDGPVHYLEYDGPSDGPVFVCVHGLGGSHVNWHSLAPLLAQRGRVFALDLAGHGRTPLNGRSAAIPANRELLDRFLRETVGAGPAILVGNSMGGFISILEAADAPHRIAGLVLVDPALPRASKQSVDRVVATTFATYMIPAIGERFVRERLRKIGPEGLVRETMALCMVDPSRVEASAMEASLVLARERAQMPWAPTAFLQAARSLVKLLAFKSRVYEKIASVTAPTLMLMGREDRLVALAAAQAVADFRPDWEFVVFDDIGHVPQIECPAQTYAAIEHWLTGPADGIVRPARDAG